MLAVGWFYATGAIRWCSVSGAKHLVLSVGDTHVVVRVWCQGFGAKYVVWAEWAALLS